MSNNKNYPLLPGQTHIEPYYTQEPTEEYEALKREVKQLREIMAGSRTTIDDIIEIKTLTSEVKALREMNVKAQEEIATLKEIMGIGDTRTICPDCCNVIKNIKANSKRNWIPYSKGGKPNHD